MEIKSCLAWQLSSLGLTLNLQPSASSRREEDRKDNHKIITTYIRKALVTLQSNPRLMTSSCLDTMRMHGEVRFHYLHFMAEEGGPLESWGAISKEAQQTGKRNRAGTVHPLVQGANPRIVFHSSRSLFLHF